MDNQLSIKFSHRVKTLAVERPGDQGFDAFCTSQENLGDRANDLSLARAKDECRFSSEKKEKVLRAEVQQLKSPKNTSHSSFLKLRNSTSLNNLSPNSDCKTFHKKSLVYCSIDLPDSLAKSSDTSVVQSTSLCPIHNKKFKAICRDPQCNTPICTHCGLYGVHKVR